MSLVQKVTVKELLPVFTMKDNVEANSIELLHCEEHDYDLIVGKGLYTIGQELLYIFPDGNLKEGHPYLDEYIFPKDKNGNPLSSKLGGFNRVKAIPFNFHTGNFNKLYSNGIVCPIDDTIESFVYKHEVVESNNGTNAVGAEKDFPDGFYKTDEKNFKQIGRNIEYPFHAIGTQKKDGSSMSLYGHFNGKRGILSRNVEKALTVRKVVSINYNWVGRLLRKIGVKPWDWTVKKIYHETESDSEFVKLGKPILDKFVTLFPELNAMVSGVLTEGFVLRGEAYGQAFKGSGNKNNLDAKEPTNYAIFTVDVIQKGRTVKLNHDALLFMKDKGFNIVPILFDKVFNSEQELIDECENILKLNKYEGVVIRNQENTFSCKYMSNEYDSKK